MLALIDTGAAITIINKEMAPLLGIFHLLPPQIPCALGMAGVPVKLLGSQRLEFEIGSFVTTHLTYFTEGAAISKLAGAYNIILGNDLLSTLPRWYIDYQKHTFHCGNFMIRIFTSGGLSNQGEQKAIVRAASTTVVHPASETFVPCVIFGRASSYMLISQNLPLVNNTLLISPAVVSAPTCRVLVTNPTNNPHVIHKNQAVASAIEVAEGSVVNSGITPTLCCNSATEMNNTHMSPSTEHANGEIPRLQVDLSVVAAEDAEKQTLLDLFHEYSDRFSFSSYDLGSYHASQIRTYPLDVTSTATRRPRHTSHDSCDITGKQSLPPRSGTPPTISSPQQSVDLPSTSRAQPTPPNPLPSRHAPQGQQRFNRPQQVNEYSRKRRYPSSRRQEPFKRPARGPAQAEWLQRRTPDDYWHYLMDMHPWARHVKPRPLRREDLTEAQISNVLPEDTYRQVPHLGYMSSSFVRSLFPRVPPDMKQVSTMLPFIEFSTLEDAIIFRDKSQRMLEITLRGDAQPVPQERTKAPKGVRSSILLPPKLKGSYPVLYQVAAIASNSLVLEAKDFFVFMPDRRELHCILLDQFSFNIENNAYGYDKTLVSMKDFVWVYDVSPTITALRSPARCLQLAREPRTAALEINSAFFFRAANFAFVTPAVWSERHSAVVLDLARRGEFLDTVNNFKLAIEGAGEAVTITKSLCKFEWPQVQEDEILFTQSRRQVSCAVRFSEPPASLTARDWLCRQVEYFFPAYPDEGMAPLAVMKAEDDDAEWFCDRTGPFNNLIDKHDQAIRRMGKVYSMACAALAAYTTMYDDHRTHRVTGTVPSLTSYPLQIEITLSDMSSETGWTKHRPVSVWIRGAGRYTKVEIEEATFLPESRQVRVVLSAYTQTHDTMVQAVREVGRILGTTAFLDLYVKLARIPEKANPAFEAIARMRIHEDLREAGGDTTLIDLAYGATTLGCMTEEEAAQVEEVPVIDTVTIHGRLLHLTNDQQEALVLGNSRYPLIALQAAFGTGKTVVGASIAIYQAQQGQRVIVTASTNTAIAQFTNTLLGFAQANDVGVVRFVAETIAFDMDVPSTPVDLNEVLKRIGTVYAPVLSRSERETCRRFAEGRIRYERYKRERRMDLSDQEREDFIMAERYVTYNLQEMVDILFKHMNPKIVCITTASLLNTTDKKGLFRGYLDRFNLLICDEASQVPEPVFMAMVARVPTARHIYIGDVHQLQLYAKCSRLHNLAHLGAQSIMDVLQKARAVPVRNLVTTFRAHPDLISLPNTLSYEESLVSGVTAADRQLLLNIVDFPNPRLPFMFININGESVKVVHSHYNEFEQKVCQFLVTTLISKGIASADIVIICFYKEQQRRLAGFAARSGGLRKEESVAVGEAEMELIRRGQLKEARTNKRGDATIWSGTLTTRRRPLLLIIPIHTFLVNKSDLPLFAYFPNK
ncbi:unnamed protein product [Cylicocyclus nassatus]|uniref:DNA2/NAM7 helicase-like C-terminal domain-containing protein n=1 Tax=Cylicocyclus nassatus TaxID=53992 RepID=A0AA36DKK3_CYLNA|nr:unnamed protein product [Cylicocyclus nassatus]